MDWLLEAGAIVVGIAIAGATLWSAMLTVVVPRAERPYITRYHFRFVLALAHFVGARIQDPVRVDFAGWRVNYDASLLGLFAVLGLDAGAWFGEHRVLPITVP